MNFENINRRILSDETFGPHGDVRHIDPKTGEYLAEPPEIPGTTLDRHYVTYYRGNKKTLLDLRKIVRKHGWEKLSDSQKNIIRSIRLSGHGMIANGAPHVRA